MTGLGNPPVDYLLIVGSFSSFDIRLPRRSQAKAGASAFTHHCPSGVMTSVPAGGLNSNVEGGIGARVWLEYVVTIRSPFGNSMSVRSTRNLSLIRRSSF